MKVKIAFLANTFFSHVLGVNCLGEKCIGIKMCLVKHAWEKNMDKKIAVRIMVWGQKCFSQN